MEGREGVGVGVEKETETKTEEEDPEAETGEEGPGVDPKTGEQQDIDPEVETDPLVTETEGLPETKTDDRRTEIERETETDLVKRLRGTRILRDQRESPDPGQDLRRGIKTNLLPLLLMTVNSLRKKRKTLTIDNNKNLLSRTELMSNKTKMPMERNMFSVQSSFFYNFSCILLDSCVNIKTKIFSFSSFHSSSTLRFV